MVRLQCLALAAAILSRGVVALPPLPPYRYFDQLDNEVAPPMKESASTSEDVFEYEPIQDTEEEDRQCV
jgi:hypothetical protein